MLNFDNIENLAEYMFENVDPDSHFLSVIAGKELTVDIMRELLDYENVVLDLCELDYAEDYTKEYTTILFYDEDNEQYFVSIEKSYDIQNGRYLIAESPVLFHEDVNSKVLIEMQNNEFISFGEHDWFVIGEEVLEDESDYIESEDVFDTNDDTDTGIRISVRKANKDDISMFERVAEDLLRAEEYINTLFSEPFMYRPRIFC